MKNITKTLIAASLAVIIAASMTACSENNEGKVNGSDILKIDAEYDIASVGIKSDDLKTVAEQYNVPEPKLPDGAELVSIERITKDAVNPTFNLSVKQNINGITVPYELQIIIFPQDSEETDTDFMTSRVGDNVVCNWTQNRTAYAVFSSRFTQKIAESIKEANEQ